MDSDKIIGKDGEMMHNNDNLPKEIVRLNGSERLQHLITFVTFFILVITGYMLKMPEAWILKLGTYGTTIFDYRGLVHRIAGVIMIVGGLDHIRYCIFTKAGRSFMFAMIPTLKDVTDIIGNMAYYFGQRPEPPEFERFDYREKAEYLALVAGTIIISVTGIFLWSEVYWSKFVLDLSIMIHGMEACLATMAIIVWHFYQVHFKPGQFPMSRVWIDGKMSNHHLKIEHGAMYNRLVAEGKLAPVDEHDHHGHHGPKTVKQVFVEIMTYCSILFFMGVMFLLGKLLYFPPTYSAKAKTPSTGFDRLIHSGGDTAKYTRHFHNVDDTVNLKLANPQFCVTCHGTLPHSKAPDIRSFLNMHSYFMACEVCHDREENFSGKFNYVWFDNMTDEKVDKIEGSNGVYGSRLIPVLVSDSNNGNEIRRMDEAEDPNFIKSYIAQKDILTPEEQGKAKVIIHKNMAKKPVQCTECHSSKQPYIDLARIGYSQKRAESLYRTEVADMINRYMQFYLPTMFDPDLMRKQKINELKMENRSTQ
ncbi:MAG: cytochrome b/b6 domain-containing protein [Proteobacteria bacterium]|nr:cytochrome b/b6 domain-containing protein [Pseudomonadota bacterium]MBU4295688.1 cytochrome b/b6 domain-containing protein [Pseudomonadota bacterium]MCG2746880.1 cytochrome b/b6 domain-containing protein [Desulfobulbaceae bacterium]